MKNGIFSISSPYKLVQDFFHQQYQTINKNDVQKSMGDFKWFARQCPLRTLDPWKMVWNLTQWMANLITGGEYMWFSQKIKF